MFDIELDAPDPDDVVRIVKALEPTFGGINLEDISAPQCFEIEERLSAAMDIPVFHDDQHGTAIISGAALLNALELAGKNIGEVRMVVQRRRGGGDRLLRVLSSAWACGARTSCSPTPRASSTGAAPKG